MSPHDVVVVGGGPGGCACGLTLRAHAPGLSVVLLEASDYSAPRLGETLPPAAGAVLRHLGVWEAFLASGPRPVYGTVAAWGAGLEAENDYLFHRAGEGWHLERSRFDAMLAVAAAAAGVEVRAATRLVAAERADALWRLRLSTGETLAARQVVDATGAGASFARRCGGAANVVSDRLAGFARFFRETRPADPRTRVEAFAQGWGYTAGLPGGMRVAVCMTDSDLAGALSLAEADPWMALVARAAPGIAAALDGAEPVGGVVVRAARSRRLDPAAGEGWLAVGDAASSVDPLSSQGVLRALRSGIYGGYAVGDLLARGDPAGVERYRAFASREYAGYLRSRARYYAQEARWPEETFWRRRRGAAIPQPEEALA